MERAVGAGDPAAGGATSVHFAQVIEKLGIAAEVKNKTKYPAPAGFVNTLLLNGDVDIAIQTKPELTAPGIEIVGGFPGEFANITVYAAGVGAQFGKCGSRQGITQISDVAGSRFSFQGEGLRSGLKAHYARL